MTTKDEKYEAIVATTDLGGQPGDPNPFIKAEQTGTERLIIEQVNENRKAEARLDALGFTPDGVEGGRSTFCLEWIINNVLSSAQRDNMTLAWMKHYGEILKQLEVQAREVVVAQQRAKLATPKPSALIVPRGVRRPDRS